MPFLKTNSFVKIWLNLNKKKMTANGVEHYLLFLAWAAEFPWNGWDIIVCLSVLVGDQLGILDHNLRPRPIRLLNIVIIFLNFNTLYTILFFN